MKGATSGKSEVYNKESGLSKPVNIVIIRLSQKLSDTEQESIEAWIHIRFNDDTARISFEVEN